jgi:hypothetical protein
MDGVWGREARVIQTPKSLIGVGSKAAEAPGLGGPTPGQRRWDAGLTRPRVSCGRDTRGFVAFRVDWPPPATTIAPCGQGTVFRATSMSGCLTDHGGAGGRDPGLRGPQSSPSIRHADHGSSRLPRRGSGGGRSSRPRRPVVERRVPGPSDPPSRRGFTGHGGGRVVPATHRGCRHRPAGKRALAARYRAVRMVRRAARLRWLRRVRSGRCALGRDRVSLTAVPLYLVRRAHTSTSSR